MINYLRYKNASQLALIFYFQIHLLFINSKNPIATVSSQIIEIILFISIITSLTRGHFILFNHKISTALLVLGKKLCLNVIILRITSVH